MQLVSPVMCGYAVQLLQVCLLGGSSMRNLAALTDHNVDLISRIERTALNRRTTGASKSSSVQQRNPERNQIGKPR
jgi:hypothetical protein